MAVTTSAHISSVKAALRGLRTACSRGPYSAEALILIVPEVKL